MSDDLVGSHVTMSPPTQANKPWNCSTLCVKQQTSGHTHQNTWHDENTELFLFRTFKCAVLQCKKTALTNNFCRVLTAYEIDKRLPLFSSQVGEGREPKKLLATLTLRENVLHWRSPWNTHRLVLSSQLLFSFFMRSSTPLMTNCQNLYSFCVLTLSLLWLL